MISFEFSVRPGQGEASGFDLGDMAVTGEEGVITSTGHSPDQGMMIHLTLCTLLDGFRDFAQQKSGSWTFYAVDSSYRLTFVLHKGSIVVKGWKAQAGSASVKAVAEALLTATEAWMASTVAHLPPGDIAADDLAVAVPEFRDFVRGL